MVRFILSKSKNIFFNLACEEYLLKNTSDNVCMLWSSVPAVVVGKHQNTNAEINAPFLYRNKIDVARRISGGGTVYHDAFNLNFTFIENGTEGKLIDFKKYLQPVVNYLNQIGVNAIIGASNDIRINGLKISGNAEHVFRKRVLHHGTLLFNSDLGVLNKAIDVAPGRYFDKAVKSKRAVVTNILEHVPVPVEFEIFTRQMFNALLNLKDGAEKALGTDEINAIESLVATKFSRPEWVYGYSPKYTFKNTQEWNAVLLEIELYVVKGIVEEAKITGTNRELASKIESLIYKQMHCYPHLLEFFKNNGLNGLAGLCI